MKKKKVIYKRKKYLYYFFLLIILVPLFLIINISREQKTSIKIPPENTHETTNWKLYENKDYHFSFEYPDYMLSNFMIDTLDNTQQGIKGSFRNNNKDNSSGIPTYNVIFEANAWKYKGSLSDFINKGPLGIKKMERQSIELKKMKGVRVTNINSEKKEEVYYYYNLFKKGDFVYDFALFSDDKVLINANSGMLNEIMATVKFYPIH